MHPAYLSVQLLHDTAARLGHRPALVRRRVRVLRGVQAVDGLCKQVGEDRTGSMLGWAPEIRS